MLICQVSDLHLCPPGHLAYGKVDTNSMSERAMAAIARFEPAPAAVLVTGDLVDCGGDAAYGLFRELSERHLRAPLYVIPGNHDAREPLRRVLAGLPGIDADARFIQYVVDDLPVRLVMLDTLVPGANHGELCDERLDFLERSLAAAPDRPTMVAMHHPPFSTGIDFMDHDKLRNAAAFAAIIARHRQVERIVCGHVHRCITGRVAHATATIAPSPCHQVALELRPGAPGATTLEPPGFLVHRLSRTDGIATHLAYVGPSPGPFPFSAP